MNEKKNEIYTTYHTAHYLHLADAFIQYTVISISNKANNINHRYVRYMIRICMI